MSIQKEIFHNQEQDTTILQSIYFEFESITDLVNHSNKLLHQNISCYSEKLTWQDLRLKLDLVDGHVITQF